jgi:hypothetical protein
MIARRPTRLTASTYTGAVFSLLVAAAVLASSVPARAADDDVPLDSKIMRGILESLGLRKDGEAINYQERAPLVIPPSRTLPPPERSDAVIANNPAWPKDPDVQRKKEEKALARQRSGVFATDQILHDQSVLRPDQLAPGPKPRTKGGSSATNSSQSSTHGLGDRLTPTELGYKGGFFGKLFGGREEEVAKFTGEPPRASLTEPPPGYQTPSPDQPYGLSERTTAPKATKYLETHVEGSK